MAIFKLKDQDVPILVKLPETGMGFQLVEATIGRRAKPEVFLVLNSQYLVSAPSGNEMMANLEEIASQDVGILDQLKDVEEVRFSDAESVKLIASLVDRSIGIMKPAQDLLHEHALLSIKRDAKPEAYFRFSANPKDPRVTADGDFIPRTYATTYNDIRVVPSGLAAVGRYALPNPSPARYVYPIITKATLKTPIHMSAVAPDFGQAGGGVQAYFPNGAKMIRGEPHSIWPS